MIRKKQNNSAGTFWVIRNVQYGTYLHRDLFTPLLFDSEQAAARYMAQRRISRRIYKAVEMEREDAE